MLTRAVFVVGVVLSALASGGTSAWADGGSSAVACQQSSAPGCTVTVGDSTVVPASNATVQVQAGVTSGGTCRDWRGKPAPCTDPTWGWMGSNGCYWQVDTQYQPPAWDTADQHPGEAGAWFLFTCLDDFPGTGGGIVWLPTAGGVAAPLPAPDVLARQAVNQLSLAGPRIETSPTCGTVGERADLVVAGAVGVGVGECHGVGAGGVGYRDREPCVGHVDARRRDDAPLSGSRNALCAWR